jgi:protein-S-isoprenylcysteine O-methyltransferase Ste14
MAGIPRYSDAEEMRVLTSIDILVWSAAVIAVALANVRPRQSHKAGPGTFATHRRTFGDVILFSVTAIELAALFLVTPTFTIADWIYVLQHALVLGIALGRRRPRFRDDSLAANAAVIVAYSYPYAQVLYLRWVTGYAVSSIISLVLVTAAAGLSLASLLALGKFFGVRPAVRGLATKGPYRVVRHPIYLSYVLADVGYNLQEWNCGTLLLVMLGWVSLLYRIRAEERLLSKHARWPAYSKLVPQRIVPGLW